MRSSTAFVPGVAWASSVRCAAYVACLAHDPTARTSGREGARGEYQMGLVETGAPRCADHGAVPKRSQDAKRKQRGMGEA